MISGPFFINADGCPALKFVLKQQATAACYTSIRQKDTIFI